MFKSYESLGLRINRSEVDKIYNFNNFLRNNFNFVFFDENSSCVCLERCEDFTLEVYIKIVGDFLCVDVIFYYEEDIEFLEREKIVKDFFRNNNFLLINI